MNVRFKTMLLFSFSILVWPGFTVNHFANSNSAILFTNMEIAPSWAPPGSNPCTYNNSYYFSDPRDGKKYRQVQIGTQCWMAQNLDFGLQVDNMEQNPNLIVEKTCYQNFQGNCVKYGALYTWEEAMNNLPCPAGQECQGICVPGWHVPSDKEWQILERQLEISIDSEKNGWRGNEAGKILLIKKNEMEKSIGTDKVGFSAKGGGTAVSGWFFYEGRSAYFWTSTRFSESGAIHRSLYSEYEGIYKNSGDIKLGFSLRCVKD